ncbi:hypothetical protein [Janthinobacterium fluminis]|uniref:DUF192 domain-containing protein n=1 Tax=Janthinobacterium fluminis TaxID=2987524 RepID=A0ABT5JV53_9BURK|nr:hypothetical protein [Janthinobacterium fluminis]MDC8756622.1 hypothetical protein [Janthinobacterium fluminis]
MQLHQVMAAAAIAAALAAGGCGKQAGTKPAAPKGPAVQLLPDGGKRITLREIDSRHLGIELAEVRQGADGLVIPYAALLYDPTGKELAYMSTAANTFVRAPLKVKAIEGDTVTMLEGPPPGAKLVTKGAVELYGIDFGVGK